MTKPFDLDALVAKAQIGTRSLISRNGPTPTLKALLSQKTGTLPILQALVDALGADIQR